jgi:hypothetical protein
VTSKTAKIVVVLAAAAMTGIGAGLAAAASPTASSTTNYTVEGMRQYIRPLESITVPTMLCGSGGYLQDRDYSPGRIVPRGVQVIEPGGVGVTITNPTYGSMDPTGSFRPLIGTYGHSGWSSATNWAFTGHELQINLHCTTDINQAAKEPVVP